MLKSSAPSATMAGPGTLQSTPARARDRDLWFDDGTIIIVAQNTEFRVYREYLSERSEVFRDMFSFGHPTIQHFNARNAWPDFRLTGDVGSILDINVENPFPVVHVPDSARDWRNVLRLLFHPEDPGLFLKRSDPSFDVLSACVRLGDKYQMPAIYKQGMDYLKGHFTTNLSVYKSRTNWVPPGFTLAHAIGVVNLARLTGVYTLLPVALMACCRMGADILEGFTYSDGERETLSTEDLGLCFVAKPKLLKATILTYFTTYASLPPGTCDLKEGGDACRRALQGLSDIAAREGHSANLPDPFILLNYSLPDTEGARLCKSCSTAIEERQLQEQRDNWELLPSMGLGIDVPGW
ncbi:hypothetical protein C8T65DRAFT_652336 [Cerioporus squamosus]|nr:hypothetical protein C8T65DRAFT_652336 [Cerioporus squamosus]